MAQLSILYQILSGGDQEMSEQILRYLGIGIENAFGTEANADIHVDIASAGLDSPNQPELRYEGGLRRSLRLHKPGMYIPSGPVEYAFDINSIFYLLYLVLGSYSTDGPDIDGFYTNTIQSLANSLELPSASFHLGKDQFEHTFLGGVVSQLTITVSKEFAMVSAEVIAQKDKKNTIKAIAALSLPSEYPLAFHELTIAIDNVARSADIESVTLTINNNASGESAVRMGSRYPVKAIAGNFDVSLSMDLDFESTAEKEKFWGGASGPADAGTTEVDIDLTFNAGAAVGNLVFSIPKFVYDEVGLKPSGRSRMIQSISGTAFYDTVSSAAILATLTNLIDYSSYIS